MKRFTELSDRDKAVELLRWAAVPPVAIGIYVAISIFWLVVVPWPTVQPPGSPVATPSDFSRYVLPRIFGLLTVFAIVFIGAKVAPRQRLVAALALAALCLLYSSFRFVVVHLGQGTPQYIDLALATAAAFAAIAAVYYTEQSKGAIIHG